MKGVILEEEILIKEISRKDFYLSIKSFSALSSFLSSHLTSLLHPLVLVPIIVLEKLQVKTSNISLNLKPNIKSFQLQSRRVIDQTVLTDIDIGIVQGHKILNRYIDTKKISTNVKS